MPRRLWLATLSLVLLTTACSSDRPLGAICKGICPEAAGPTALVPKAAEAAHQQPTDPVAAAMADEDVQDSDPGPDAEESRDRALRHTGASTRRAALIRRRQAAAVGLVVGRAVRCVRCRLLERLVRADRRRSGASRGVRRGDGRQCRRPSRNPRLSRGAGAMSCWPNSIPPPRPRTCFNSVRYFGPSFPVRSSTPVRFAARLRAS